MIESNKYYSDHQPALGDLIGTYSGKLNPADTTWYIENKDLISETGLLRDEFANLYPALFQNSENHVKINHMIELYCCSQQP